VLARQPEQQRRRVVLHRPGQQELVELLKRRLLGRAPSPIRHRRHPEYCNTSRRWSVRVCSHSPYPASTPASRCSWSANRPTAAGGAAVTSSGTNPSHARVHSCTARPRRSHGERPRPGSTNARSAAGQREEPDQLIPGDLGEAAQLDQFLLGEHPSRHTTAPPSLIACRRFPVTLKLAATRTAGHIRLVFRRLDLVPQDGRHSIG